MSTGAEVLEPCQGCGAGAGEPCREWCLSTVTDDAGRPVEADGVTPTCDVCGWDEPTAADKMGWCGSCGCCADHCQDFVDCGGGVL